MYLTLSTLLLGAIGVYGYENSSPLFLFSTSNLNVPSIQHLSSASSIQSILNDALSQCPTQNYVVVQQSGVSSDDYVCPKNTRFLRDRVASSADGNTGIMVRDVLNTIYAADLVDTIKRSCKKDIYYLDSDHLSYPTLNDDQLQNNIIYTTLPPLESSLSAEDRKIILRNHDVYLESLVETYFHNEDYTLVYVTESVHAAYPVLESYEYDAEIPFMHSGELRRSLEMLKNKSKSNQTVVDGPLFDKYQFFTPGIFMGGLVGLLLLSILYVGISALASLQVTYGAFDKEQGQLAAKKQQ